MNREFSLPILICTAAILLFVSGSMAQPADSIELAVLLVDFTDSLHGDYTETDFCNMLFAEGVYSSPMTSPDGEQVFGSLRDFFYQMSNGTLIITGSVLNIDDPNNPGYPQWLTLPDSKDHYAYQSPLFFYQDIDTAVQGLYDISTSATRKVAIVYAGNYWDTSGLNPAIGPGSHPGMYHVPERWQLDEENTDPEYAPFAHIGLHCHELGHLLGLEDLYNTCCPVYHWALMGYGCDNGPEMRGSCPAAMCPEDRYRLSNIFGSNWLDYEEITGNEPDKNLTYSGHGSTVYLRELAPIGNMEFERFWVENRQLSGQDFNQYLPGHDDSNPENKGGLLIWHIWSWSSEESPEDIIDLVEADGSENDILQHEATDPFRNRDFNDCTSPTSNRRHNLGSSRFALGNISGSDIVMTADFSVDFGKGDVDEDCHVNIQDVYSVVEFILSFEQPTLSQEWAADMNNDETINVLDALLIINMILGRPADQPPAGSDKVRLVELAGGQYEVRLENSGPVAGVELCIDFDSTFQSFEKTGRSAMLDSSCNSDSLGVMDTLIVVLYGSNGDTIPAGNGSVVNLSFSPGASLILTCAVLSTPGGQEIPVEIYNECGSPALVKGTVKDNSTQNPIPNALTKLYTSGGAYTGKSDYSDTYGYFEITAIDPGSYYVMITKTGYTDKRDPGTGSFEVGCAETENRGIVYMTPTCNPGIVKGYVKYQVSGNPINGALSQLYTSGGSYTGKSATTNSSGYFQITNVSSGDYYLMVSKDDYQTKRDPSSGSFNVACAETENRGTIYLSCSPPETPTGLAGTWVYGQPSNHPQLTWNTSTGATGYVIYKSLDGSPYAALDTAYSTSYIDSGFCSGGGLVDMSRYKVSAFDSCDESAMTSNYVQFRGYQCAQSKLVAEAPEGYLLFQNYPNPFNPETEIAFGLAEPSYVRLVVHNILGQEVRVLVDGYIDGAYHTLRWDSRNEEGDTVPAGVYLYRLETDRFSDTKRMILLK